MGGICANLPKVDKTTFSKEDDVAAVGHSEAINLRLDVHNRLGISFQPSDIDLNIEVADAEKYDA